MKFTKMLRLSMIILPALLTISPAMAWDYNQYGNHNQQIGDGATGTQNNNSAQSRASSRSSSSSASHSNAVASGGNVSISGGYGDANNGAVTALGVPSASASGNDCPVIGPGIGGQSGLAAGIFSWGYISPDCNKRRTVDILRVLYGPAVARAYAERNIDGVADAVRAAQGNAHTQEQTKIRDNRPDYCFTASAGERRQHLECQLTTTVTVLGE